MKTKTLSITSAAVSEVLKNCQTQNIKATYLGIAYSNDLFMELTYEEGQEPFIHQLTAYVENAAQSACEMRNVINQQIDKVEGEDKKILKEFFAAIKIQILEPFKYNSHERERG